MNRIAAGPIVTIQMAGKMHSTSGNTIFTPVFAAASSARCRRLVLQRVGEHAKRVGDARAELVGLDQHGDERVQIVDAGAIRQIAQRVRSAGAGEQLEAHEPKLAREIDVRELELLRDARHRLVESEARLDADDHQVERIGERQPDAVLALLRFAREDEAGNHVADAHRGQRRQQVRPAEERRHEDREAPERERDADAEEHEQRLAAAIPGLDEAEPQLAELLRRFCGARSRQSA